MAELSIRDAFKALEEVEDIIEVNVPKKKVVNEKVDKKKATKSLKEAHYNDQTKKVEPDWFYGIQGIEFIWHGEQSDPEVAYNGKIYNYFDLEDMLWDDYREDHPEDRNGDNFADWVFENSYLAKDYLEILTPTDTYEESLKVNEGKKPLTNKQIDSRVKRNLKYLDHLHKSQDKSKPADEPLKESDDKKTDTKPKRKSKDLSDCYTRVFRDDDYNEQKWFYSTYPDVEVVKTLKGNHYTKIWYRFKDTNESLKESEELTEKPVYGLNPQFDSRKSFYGKANVEVTKDGSQVLYSYNTPVCYISKNGDVKLLTKWDSSMTTLRHVKEFLQQNKKQSGSSKELAKLYPEVSYDDLHEECKVTESVDVNIFDKEDRKKGFEELKKDETETEPTEQIVDVDAETIDELKDSYLGNAILQCPVCRTLIYKKPEALVPSEDENLFNMEDECPHCGAKEGFEVVGQVATLDVETVEEEPTTGAPGSDEVGDDIDIEDEETFDEEDIKLENLDETNFNKLINKYVHNIYENVDNYKCTGGTVDNKNNKLIIEGVIKFKSGKEEKTKFIFEASSVTKDRKIKFKGLNETFTHAKSPFTLIGSIQNKKLVCEAFKYNYNVKVLNENKKVKGKISATNK